MAEIPPRLHLYFMIHYQPRYDAHREVPRYSPADLEEAYLMVLVVFAVPLSEMRELLGSGLYDVETFHFSLHHVGREHVPECGVFHARSVNGDAHVAGGNQPGIFHRHVVFASEKSAFNQFIKIFGMEMALALLPRRLPKLQHRLMDFHHYVIRDARIGHAVVTFLPGGHI